MANVLIVFRPKYNMENTENSISSHPTVKIFSGFDHLLGPTRWCKLIPRCSSAVVICADFFPLNLDSDSPKENVQPKIQQLDGQEKKQSFNFPFSFFFFLFQGDTVTSGWQSERGSVQDLHCHRNKPVSGRLSCFSVSKTIEENGCGDSALSMWS